MTTKECGENLERSDPVLNTFNQYLLRARKINNCYTTEKIRLPGRTINVHFVSNNNYVRLICDNAADVGTRSDVLEQILIANDGNLEEESPLSLKTLLLYPFDFSMH